MGDGEQVGHSGVEVHPDDPSPDLSQTEEEVIEYVKEHLPLGDKLYHQDCWYTVSLCMLIHVQVCKNLHAVTLLKENRV